MWQKEPRTNFSPKFVIETFQDRLRMLKQIPTKIPRQLSWVSSQLATLEDGCPLMIVTFSWCLDGTSEWMNQELGGPPLRTTYYPTMASSLCLVRTYTVVLITITATAGQTIIPTSLARNEWMEVVDRVNETERKKYPVTRSLLRKQRQTGANFEHSMGCWFGPVEKWIETQTRRRNVTIISFVIFFCAQMSTEHTWTLELELNQNSSAKSTTTTSITFRAKSVSA